MNKPKQPIPITNKDIKLFFDFCAERQKIWHRRHILKQPWPWTSNQILRTYSFTNLYRELDPGTWYVVEKIMNRKKPAEDRLFNLLIYRTMSRRSTHEATGFIDRNSFQPERYESFLRQLQKSGETVFGNAYLTSSFAAFNGVDKIESIVRCFSFWKSAMPSIWKEIEACKELPHIYRTLRTLPGVGNFIAYQTIVDMSYPLRSYNVSNMLELSWKEFDNWVEPGPGAIKGIQALSAVPLTTAEASNLGLKVLKYLQRIHIDELEKRDFPWLQQGFTPTSQGTGEKMSLSIPDLQNCLCEYFKMYGHLNGTRGRGRFYNRKE